MKRSNVVNVLGGDCGVRPRQSLEALKVGKQLIQDDAAKAQILQQVFFPKLPPASLRTHNELDASWNTTRPPGKDPRMQATVRKIR